MKVVVKLSFPYNRVIATMIDRFRLASQAARVSASRRSKHISRQWEYMAIATLGRITISIRRAIGRFRALSDGVSFG